MTATLSSPELLKLEPNTAKTTDGAFVLGVRGMGFTMQSQVLFDGEPQASGMLGQDLLSAPFDPAWWHGEPVTIEVKVKTGDHVTAVLPFTLMEDENGREREHAADNAG
jgi:hypothetical protein